MEDKFDKENYGIAVPQDLIKKKQSFFSGNVVYFDLDSIISSTKIFYREYERLLKEKPKEEEGDIC